MPIFTDGKTEAQRGSLNRSPSWYAAKTGHHRYLPDFKTSASDHCTTQSSAKSSLNKRGSQRPQDVICPITHHLPVINTRF